MLQRFTSSCVQLILGDLIDEAYIATEAELDLYYQRFSSMFEVSDAKIVSVPGDNDIGGEGVELQTTKHIEAFERRHGLVNEVVIRNGMQHLSMLA